MNQVRNQSTHIFEGTVVETKSYWNPQNNFIYTSNIVEVEAVFKGSIPDSKVEVITRGGKVNETRLEISHNLKFVEGEKGMFFAELTNRPLDPSTTHPWLALEVREQVFVRYFGGKEKRNNPPAIFRNHAFECKEQVRKLVQGQPFFDCNMVFFPPNMFAMFQQTVLESKKRAKKAVSSPVNTQLEFTFENVAVTGITTKFLEFDIYIEANDFSSYIDMINARISYNTAAFGTEVEFNNKLIVTRGTAVASTSDYQNISYGDISTSEFAMIILSVNNVQNRYNVTPTPVQLFHVKMEIADCNVLTDLLFIEIGVMESLSTYTTCANCTSLLNYNIIAPDFLNIVPCDINILNFIPANPPLIAGENNQIGTITGASTRSELTITGTNFGSVQGSGFVQLKNADDGGSTLLPLDAYDYISWSDNEIRINVPSLIPIGSSTPNTPGSGSVLVQNNAGQQTLSVLDEIDIYYALTNYTAATIKNRLVLSGVNADKGFDFKLNADLAANLPAVDAITFAMDDWVCITEVRFTISDSTTTIDTAIRDSISVITFGTIGSSLTLAETQIWSDRCLGPLGLPDEIGYVFDIDIVISDNPSITWFYDNTLSLNIPPGENDFYEVILHEIGHGVLLQHVLDSNRVMWWQSRPGPRNVLDRRSFLTFSEMDGGIDVVQMSKNMDYSICADSILPMIPIPSAGVCTSQPSSIKNEAQGDFNNLIIYPNPTLGEINLEFNLQEREDLKIVIYDVIGKLVYFEKLENRTGLFNQHIDLSQLSNGMYLLNVELKETTYRAKIIKQY